MAFDSSRSQGYVSQIPVFTLFLFIIYVLWLDKNDSILILFSQSGVIQEREKEAGGWWSGVGVSSRCR